MADGTADVARSLAQLTTTLIEQMTRLAIMLIERRAQRLREAARLGEQEARKERARLERHHAGDKAIWKQTADPDWWARATPERMARAWRAATVWQQADPEAAGARQAMAERLRDRGVDVTADVSANPADAQWLRTALDLAQAEKGERIAFQADTASSAELAEDLAPETESAAPAQPAGHDQATAAADTDASDRDSTQNAATKAPATVHTGEVDGEAPAADELPSPKQQTSNTNGSTLDVDGFIASLREVEAVRARVFGKAIDAAADASDARKRLAETTAIATQPDGLRDLPEQEMSRLAEVVQQAWQDQPDRVHKVLSDGAWPTLAISMQRLQSKGHDVAGLLSRIPAETTESAIPAVTTSWALRASAAGPSSLQRMMDSRLAHQQRLTAARQHQAAALAMAPQEPGDNMQQLQSGDAQSTEGARLLNAAFPQDTKTALNQNRQGTPDGARQTRDRDRDKVAAQAEMG
jgi:hypothetical protein